MTASSEPPQKNGDLHASKTPDAESKRKRRSEARVARSVAEAMAGEAIAAVTGHGKKDKKGD